MLSFLVGNAPYPHICESGAFCIFIVTNTLHSICSTRSLALSGVLVAFVLLATPATSFAWGEEGHRVVAYIAYGRLNARAKAMANKLLQIPLPPLEISQHSTDFVAASTWADEIRNDSAYKQTAPWHYIDYPFGLTPETILPVDLPEKGNIVTALKRESAILRNPTAKQTARAVALRFIIHFVGDVHQPLHCATRVSPLSPHGDRGGNDYRIRPAEANENESLHAYWDAGLGEFSPSSGSIKEMATRAIQANPPYIPDWKKGGVTGYDQWARESKWLANNFVYTDLRRGKELPENYRKSGKRIVNKRVAWAGYRLALLLNVLLAGE